MNTVLLLFSIGIIIFNSEATSGYNIQKNHIEHTSQEKPPKLLWDPEKRMWIENDGDDFIIKDHNDSDVVEEDGFSFLDNATNYTDSLEEIFGQNYTNIDVDCGACIEDAQPESSPASVVTTPPSSVFVSPVAKASSTLTTSSVDDHVKYEEKTTSSIETPLSQALDTPLVKNSGDIDSVDEKSESHSNIVVEVNPVTEYPLWPLEFESKRTRPLLKEFVKLNPTEQNTASTNNAVGVTKLQVIPLDDIDPLDGDFNNKYPFTKQPFPEIKSPTESKIINVQPFTNNPSENLPSRTVKSGETLNKKGITYISDGSVRDPHDPTRRRNSTPNHFEDNLRSNAEFEYKYPVKTGIKQIYPSTTSKPDVDSRATLNVGLSSNALLESVINGEEKEDKQPHSSTESIKHSSSSPVNTINLTWTPSPDYEISKLPPSTPSAEKDTGIDDIIDPSLSIKTCQPSITLLGETTLHWPETPYNVTTIPEEICLEQDGIPITRTCYNGTWSPILGTCSNIEFSTKTLILNELLNSKVTTSNSITQNLTQITTDVVNVTSYQIHLMSKLLERVASSEETANVQQVAKTVSNIMHCEKTKLRLAQYMLNSTDKILCSLDDSLLKTRPSDNGYRSIVTEKLLVQEANLQKTDISGYRLKTSGKQKGFQPDDLTTLNPNTEMVDKDHTNLELALLIPEKLKTGIKQCNGSHANPNVITTIFYDDVLFNNNETKASCVGKIISVLLPGFDCLFSAPLQIIFKPHNDSNIEHKCAYWRYGSNNQSENIKGHWVVDGTPKPYFNTTYKLCEFSHATHFSLLVLGNLALEIGENDKKALDIITAVGSGLSLLGLLAVFITAITFRSYRSANAVVIHFSVAMAAQIIVLFLADQVDRDELMCTIFGAALHYIVISQFCWMLTIALLQYKRYVLVFSNPTKCLMTKACAFAWGVPLIPIIVILSISTHGYGRNSYGLCYAMGNYFIFGVLIPVAVIVFINLLVFLRIMIYIASRKIKAHRKMDNATTLQLRLAIMLYFLLGLTWGFGLVAAIGGGVIYSYLFCLTATLQGFVLFLFFIALSDKTRSLWAGMLWCPCVDKTKKYDVNTDSSSHPMVRRPTSTNTSDTFSDGTGNEMYQKYKNRSSLDF